MLAWRSGCIAWKGGFCQVPSGFCVQRHTHPLRPLDQRGQGARQFRQIALVCYRLLCRRSTAPTPSLSWRRRFRASTRRRVVHHQNGISSFRSSAKLGCAAGFAGGCSGSTGFCTVAGRRLLRRRDPHPQRRHHLAAKIGRAWKQHDDLPGPTGTSRHRMRRAGCGCWSC